MLEIWTDARVERVRELALQNVNVTNIAKTVGVSRSAIKRMCRRRGIGLPQPAHMNWQGALIDRVRELALQGVSAGDIGKELSMSRGAITGLCYRQGIKLCGAYKLPIRQANKGAPKRKKVLPRAAITTAHTGTPKQIKPNDYSLFFNGPEEVRAPPEPEPCEHVTFRDLDEVNHCRWVIGHPHNADTVFCGAQREQPGLPSDKTRNFYCAYHNYLAHHTPPKPEDHQPCSQPSS